MYDLHVTGNTTTVTHVRGCPLGARRRLVLAGSGRPTVRDIAAHAGVSVATVSRVTRDDPRVRAEMRARVQASIDALGYTPSALGLGLAYQRHNSLGVVLPGLGGPYFAELIRGVESVTARGGIAVNVLGTQLRPDATVAVQRLADRTDALVVQGMAVEEDPLVDLARSMPVVVVGGDPGRLPTVRVDGACATRELTAHLTDVHQHRRLRFVGVPDRSPDMTSRYHGFRQALAERGLEEAGSPLPAGFEAQHGAAAARRLHGLGELPDALVCANDELAFGMLATLPGLGHPVPTEVAVVGFDDNSLADLAAPRLTTVHQPTFDLGALAAELALPAPRSSAGPFLPLEPDDRVLPTRTVIRESCGCTPERHEPRAPASDT